MVKWALHVAPFGEMRNAYEILVRRPEGKRALGRSGPRCDGNIKMPIKIVSRWGTMAVRVNTPIIGHVSENLYCVPRTLIRLQSSCVSIEEIDDVIAFLLHCTHKFQNCVRNERPSEITIGIIFKIKCH
jgi:hypothetical protein